MAGEGRCEHCAEADRRVANARKIVMLVETFIYEPQRITEGGLVAQIQRFMTDQDVEFLD